MSSKPAFKLPKDVEDKINKISVKYDVPKPLLIEEYREIYNRSSLEKAYKTDDEQRHAYASNLLGSNYYGREQQEKYSVVPVGHTGITKSRTGGKTRQFYMIVIDDTGRNLKKVFLDDDTVDIIKNITFGCSYSINANMKDSGQFAIDDRTKFNNPQSLGEGVRLKDVLEEYLGIKTFTMAELNDDVCAKLVTRNNKEYPDDFDWRHIRGTVMSAMTGTFPKTGDPYGKLIITDGTAEEISVQVIDPNTGAKSVTSKRPLLTVWVDPVFGTIPKQSCIDIFGFVKKSLNKLNNTMEYQMTGTFVDPVFIMQK